MQKNNTKGFTLIELLIVIAIIAILAAVVFVSLKPATRFESARDARRQTDIETIASALVTYQADNSGSFPASVEALTLGSSYIVGTAASGCDSGCTATTTQTACVDLAALVTGGYMGSVPQDPSSGTAAKTLYYVTPNTSGTITAGACVPEGSSAISTTR